MEKFTWRSSLSANFFGPHDLWYMGTVTDLVTCVLCAKAA